MINITLVDTKIAGYDIPLYQRGDGIRLWYIPSILHHIAKISPKYFIWGFDEPENSCEYSLTNKLSNDFLNVYSNNSQIFISTHSFSFISIGHKNCSHFRIYKNDTQNTEVMELSKLSSQKHKLLDELGIIEINSRLKKVYDEVKIELENIKDLKDELNSNNKPFLIFEGESDSVHFKKAYNVLYDRHLISKWSLCDHIKSESGSSIGDGASHLNNFLYNYIGKIDTNNLIISIFDYDEEGLNQIKALKGLFDDISSNYSDRIVYRHKKKKNVFAITIVPPSFRMNFVDKNQPHYSYLSTELLFQDVVLDPDKRKFPSKRDTSVFSFKGKKIAFANKIDRIPDSALDCSGFSETFNLLDEISENLENG